jgi:transcriptional regulator with XRE-family HTH domain/sRNA-binding regulator protein Hfq
MEDLWRIRQRKQMSVSELSAKSGVPARRIQEYEAGKRAITSSDLPRLARALYVEEWEIKPLSDPIPQPRPEKPKVPGPAPRPPQPSAPPVAQAPKPPKPARPKAPPKRKAALGQQPARPSQIEHLRQLAAKLALDEAALEKRAGKPLAALTRAEASALLNGLQKAIAEAAPDQVLGKRRRPYLPEAVDTFEYRYLQACQNEGASLTFVLFDGQRMEGRVVGFSPYTITIQTPSGEEVTLRKLAIAYYRREGDRREAQP